MQTFLSPDINQICKGSINIRVTKKKAIVTRGDKDKQSRANRSTFLHHLIVKKTRQTLQKMSQKFPKFYVTYATSVFTKDKGLSFCHQQTIHMQEWKPCTGVGSALCWTPERLSQRRSLSVACMDA